MNLASYFSIRKLPHLAWPTLVFLLILAPAIVVLFYGRDVDALDFATEFNPSSVAAMVGRIATATILLMTAVVIVFAPPPSFQTSNSKKRYRMFGIGIALFVLGHLVLPSILGAEPAFELNWLYGPLVLFAAYRAQSLPSDLYLGAARWGLLILMIGGFVVGITHPQIVMQSHSDEIRLTFVDFRYWGLGSSPNNIAPMALVLIFLVLFKPFRFKLVSALALVAAAATILLAQSQTTWAATLFVLPLYLFYRFTPKPIKSARIKPSVLVSLAGALLVGCMMLIWQASSLNSDGLYAQSGTVGMGDLYRAPDNEVETFTGRTAIWQVAMDTWGDHPWFGYGPTAWGFAFRQSVGLPLASNAHNQVMQSVSIGGNLALVTLVLYVMLMFRIGFRTMRQTHGLALACVTVLFIRGLTEAPLDLNTLLSGEVLLQMTIVYLLVLGLRRYKPQASKKRRQRQRSRGRRQSQAGLIDDFKPVSQQVS